MLAMQYAMHSPGTQGLRLGKMRERNTKFNFERTNWWMQYKNQITEAQTVYMNQQSKILPITAVLSSFFPCHFSFSDMTFLVLASARPECTHECNHSGGNCRRSCKRGTAYTCSSRRASFLKISQKSSVMLPKRNSKHNLTFVFITSMALEAMKL